MNRFLLVCCAALCAFSINSQTIVKEMDGAHTRFIPGAYMKSGEAAIYFSSDAQGYYDGITSYEAQIFDFELNPLKSFKFQSIQPYSVIERIASSGTMEKTNIIKRERDKMNGLPPISNMEVRRNEFINNFYERESMFNPNLTLESLMSNSRIEGTTIYIILPINDMLPNREYLRNFEFYLDESDMTGYNYTYAIEVPKCDGEWETTTWYDTPVSNFCTPKCNDVAHMNHWNGGVYLPFSQTFFNNDDRFEYVRYKAEIAEGKNSSDISTTQDPLEYLFGITANDRNGDGKEDYRETYYGVHYKGLEVVSEDGDIIYSFPIPDNCTGNASIEFFKSDNNILAQAEFNWYNDKNEYMHTVRFYRIDKTSEVAKVIRDENHLSAHPNPASSGTPVEMVLPNGNNGSRMITVTSLGGAKVFSQPIEESATKVYIPTNNLSSGIYMFTLTENGHIIETCKIIIR